MFEMANPLLYIVLCTSIIGDVTPQITIIIDTIPELPSNMLAAGYFGLIVRAQVEKENIRDFCEWSYGGELDNYYWFHEIFGCLGNINGTNETITCDEVTRNGVDYVMSNLTFKQPVTSNLSVAVLCDFGLFSQELFLTVQECPSQVSSQLVVMSLANRFGSTGTFKCLNNGKLFYSTGTEALSNQTTCLVSALWSGQDDLQCWEEPDVRIISNFAGKEGTRIEMSCEYWDVTPVGHYSVFNFGNINSTIQKEKLFTTAILQPEDNNKVVSCQAATPYTEIYKETGRSPNYVINVQYKPYQRYITSCTWLINQAGWCNVTFLANPKPRYISLNRNGSTTNNDFEDKISIVNENLWKFPFYKQNVTSADSGVYTLRVQSPVFDEDSTIVFDISVETNLDLNNQSNDLTSSLIAISCIAGLLLVLLVGLLILLMRQIRITKEIVSQNKKAIVQDHNDAIEFHPQTSTTLQNKTKNVLSRPTYLDMKSIHIQDKRNTQQSNLNKVTENEYDCSFGTNTTYENIEVTTRRN